MRFGPRLWYGDSVRARDVRPGFEENGMEMLEGIVTGGPACEQ